MQRWNGVVSGNVYGFFDIPRWGLAQNRFVQHPGKFYSQKPSNDHTQWERELDKTPLEKG